MLSVRGQVREGLGRGHIATFLFRVVDQSIHGGHSHSRVGVVLERIQQSRCTSALEFMLHTAPSASRRTPALGSCCMA